MIARISGPASESILKSLCPGISCKPQACRTQLQFARLRCWAWVYVFRAPASYSGQDMVEFHLPGNPILARMLLDELFSRGVRLAEAGEFTARAYFSGKMDLTAAEGVAATIAAGNARELSAARQLLAGELARRLRPIMDSLAQTLALVEVGIDFSEDEVAVLPCDQRRQRVEAADLALRQLHDESARFEQLVHEPAIALIGRPNAGKSTLMNGLIGRARSIVSPVAGTTRDVLTAQLDLAEGAVQLVDVAGIDHGASSDGIEHRARQRALRAVESADHVLFVRDVTDRRPPLQLPRPADLVVLTKADLLDEPVSVGDDEILVSARRGTGMDELKRSLGNLAFGSAAPGSRLVLNARHLAALSAARSALAEILRLPDDAGAEVIATELRESLDDLGGVVGIVTPDDVLSRIFSSFCIGK